MEIDATDRRTRRARLGGALVTLASILVSFLALGFIVPAAFGLERYVIAGGSMTGSISRGSVVFEEVVPVSDLRVGDVITYLPPPDSEIDQLVTHRIHSIRGDKLRTKGDANAAVDPWSFSLSAGTQPRVVAHVPYVGYLFLALQDRSTRVLAIGVPAGLVALMSLVELARRARRPRRGEGGSPVVEGRESPLEDRRRVPAPRAVESCGAASTPVTPVPEKVG